MPALPPSATPDDTSPSPSSPVPSPADPFIEMFRPLGALLALHVGAPPPPGANAPRRARPNEPADFYVNVFQDNRRHWLNAEAAFDDLSECFQSILDGQRGGTYRYTLHVSCAADGARSVQLDDFEPDARAWAAAPRAEARRL